MTNDMAENVIFTLTDSLNWCKSQSEASAGLHELVKEAFLVLYFNIVCFIQNLHCW